MKQPLVIKIGGAILDAYSQKENGQRESSALNALLAVIANLSEQPVVIVHGGGCVVDELLSQSGFVTEKLDGLRVTPKSQMPIISGALAGNVNKAIVANANTLSLNAVGLSLADGQMISCKLKNEKLGMVGVPEPDNKHLLTTLLSAGFLPIISSIGALKHGELVNVNADDAAVAICQLIQGKLLLLTDVPGVKGADGQVLAQLTQAQAEQLISQGVIAGGMTAKVNAAFHAANKLRRSIAIASWQSPEQILNLYNGNHLVVGTEIQPSN